MALTRNVTREVLLVLAWVPDTQPSELATEKDLLDQGYARPNGSELQKLAWFKERWDPTISKLHGLEYQLKQQTELHAREMRNADEGNGKLLREQEQLRARVAELEAEAQARTVCWHCKVCLVDEGLPHCDRCPPVGDCDDDACGEDGCIEKPEGGGP